MTDGEIAVLVGFGLVGVLVMGGFAIHAPIPFERSAGRKHLLVAEIPALKAPKVEGSPCWVAGKKTVSLKADTRKKPKTVGKLAPGLPLRCLSGDKQVRVRAGAKEGYLSSKEVLTQAPDLEKKAQEARGLFAGGQETRAFDVAAEVLLKGQEATPAFGLLPELFLASARAARAEVDSTAKGSSYFMDCVDGALPPEAIYTLYRATRPSRDPSRSVPVLFQVEGARWMAIHHVTDRHALLAVNGDLMVSSGEGLCEATLREMGRKELVVPGASSKVDEALIAASVATMGRKGRLQSTIAPAPREAR